MSSAQMEFLDASQVSELTSPGIVSRQLLWPKNSESVRLTITEVHLEPGSAQPRHAHEASEQVWYALRGTGTLLLAEGATRAFRAGDVVRFGQGCIHGLENSGEGEFVYLSVTAPPIDFTRAYEGSR